MVGTARARAQHKACIVGTRLMTTGTPRLAGTERADKIPDLGVESRKILKNGISTLERNAAMEQDGAQVGAFYAVVEDVPSVRSETNHIDLLLIQRAREISDMTMMRKQDNLPLLSGRRQ